MEWRRTRLLTAVLVLLYPNVCRYPSFPVRGWKEPLSDCILCLVSKELRTFEPDKAFAGVPSKEVTAAWVSLIPSKRILPKVLASF
jgi:hypothetical protein